MASKADKSPVRVSRTLRQGLVKRRRRRMLRRLKGYARFLLACVIAYGLFRFWTSPFWQWDGQMSISGNRLVTRQQLLERLEIQHNTPLYRLDPTKIGSELEKVPAIARVAVRRWLFPARLELNVIERQALVEVAEDAPAAADGSATPPPAPKPSANPNATPTPSAQASPGAPPAADARLRRWIDQEGVVFAAPPKLMTAHFAIQVHTDLPPGSHLPAIAQAHLFELLNAWPKEETGRLDLRDPADVYASIGAWPVRLGTVDDVQLKFAVFQELEPLAARYKDRLKYINLRFPASPSLVLKTGAEIKPGDHELASPAPVASTSPKPSAHPSANASPSGKPVAAPKGSPHPSSKPSPAKKPNPAPKPSSHPATPHAKTSAKPSHKPSHKP